MQVCRSGNWRQIVRSGNDPRDPRAITGCRYTASTTMLRCAAHAQVGESTLLFHIPRHRS